MTRVQTQQALRQLPVKWALALLALIVVYSFAQPAVNNRFGWNLPSLAHLLGEREPKKPVEDKTPKETQSKDAKSNESTSSSKQATSSKVQVEDTEAQPANRRSNSDSDTDSSSKAAPAQKPTPKTSTSPAKTSSKAKEPSSDGSLLYGILKDTGEERYVSAEGLQYNPGSAEGHRLKHLERHLQDMPDRPGKHGVFDGEIQNALKVIDDAYARGKRGAKGVRKSEEEGRTIYEVPFTQPIGYIGGRDGDRTGHPPAKRLRLVVEGNKFITAFPF